MQFFCCLIQKNWYNNIKMNWETFETFYATISGFQINLYEPV